MLLTRSMYGENSLTKYMNEVWIEAHQQAALLLLHSQIKQFRGVTGDLQDLSPRRSVQISGRAAVVLSQDHHWT